MAIYFRVIIKCDTCGAEFVGETSETKRVHGIMPSKDKAADAGWSIYSRKHNGEHIVKCPDCARGNNG